MKEYRLGVLESKFADIIWENEPLPTTELVKLSEKAFNWKRTTTYTVLKRLSNGGLFKLENGVVSAVITRDEFYANQSEHYVKESFGGSLPAFLNAFTQNRDLTKDEVNELKKMIKSYEEK